MVGLNKLKALSEVNDFLKPSAITPVVRKTGGRVFEGRINGQTVSFKLNQIVRLVNNLSSKAKKEDLKNLSTILINIKNMDARGSKLLNNFATSWQRFLTAIRRFFGNCFFNRSLVLAKLQTIANKNFPVDEEKRKIFEHRFPTYLTLRDTIVDDWAVKLPVPVKNLPTKIIGEELPQAIIPRPRRNSWSAPLDANKGTLDKPTLELMKRDSKALDPFIEKLAKEAAAYEAVKIEKRAKEKAERKEVTKILPTLDKELKLLLGIDLDQLQKIYPQTPNNFPGTKGKLECYKLISKRLEVLKAYLIETSTMIDLLKADSIKQNAFVKNWIKDDKFLINTEKTHIVDAVVQKKNVEQNTRVPMTNKELMPGRERTDVSKSFWDAINPFV